MPLCRIAWPAKSPTASDALDGGVERFTLSEPEEWDELLDEVGPGAERPSSTTQESSHFPFEIEVQMAAIHSDLARDANNERTNVF